MKSPVPEGLTYRCLGRRAAGMSASRLCPVLSADGDCVNQGRSERVWLFGVSLIRCAALRMCSVEVTDILRTAFRITRVRTLVVMLASTATLRVRSSVQTPDWTLKVLVTACCETTRVTVRNGRAHRTRCFRVGFAQATTAHGLSPPMTDSERVHLARAC
ncbi:hypothetical protein L226DRAFT_361281 [Lentinus tigrinus ALCF2SS1-7]|uniref:uncharacterized protein n=1 Tax=Lentinus tigrinus ALCF2SS1-7 TaxID=1328758 RepID=UPI001165D62E|nr:hypothetical protein L226DRAFT_361281 [Lentinus tigrinus ALCF2SS1-7]